MGIVCYTHNNDFNKLENSWELLLHQNKDTTVFQTLEWNHAWWNSFGQDRKLTLLALTEEEDSPIGIAPLYLEQHERGKRVLRLVGGVELTDYLDLLYLPGKEEIVCIALLNFLKENRDAWDLLEIHNIPEGSATLNHLNNAAREMGFRVAVEKENVCPYLLLPSTWESYLATLSKKDRHELRRKMRKTEKAGAVKQQVLGNQHNLSEELEEFFLLHRKSKEEKNRFMEGSRKNFFLDFTARFYSKGWLELSFLMINGNRVASLLSFKYKGNIYLYNSGYDPAFSSYSAGIALIGQSIKAAIENGYRKYDFLRGNEEYKYNLGARDLPIYLITISAEN